MYGNGAVIGLRQIIIHKPAMIVQGLRNKLGKDQCVVDRSYVIVRIVIAIV
jgi:hypothetical protein